MKLKFPIVISLSVEQIAQALELEVEVVKKAIENQGGEKS